MRSNDNPFKILIEIFLDYSKVVFKFLIILFPIIIYLIISMLLKIDILKFYVSKNKFSNYFKYINLYLLKEKNCSKIDIIH